MWKKNGGKRHLSTNNLPSGRELSRSAIMDRVACMVVVGLAAIFVAVTQPHVTTIKTLTARLTTALSGIIETNLTN